RRCPRSRYRHRAPALTADPLALGIPERLVGDLAGDPVAEDLDLDGPAGLDRGTRQVRVGDRALDAVAEAAARDATHRLAVHAHGLGAERDRAGVREDEARELPLRLRLRGLCERVAPDEVPLVELHREVEAALVGSLVGR